MAAASFLGMAFKREDDSYRKALEREMGLVSQKCSKTFDGKTRLPQHGPIPVIRLPQDTRWGELLGRGGFNEVRALTMTAKTALGRDDCCNSEGESSATATTMAMKHLRSSIKRTRHEFYAGAVDLIMEAKLLNALQHDNIIRLHGVSCPDKDLPKVYLKGGYYCLYLDRLYGTVNERLNELRKEECPATERLLHRIETIALPIARALEYLHSNHVIFRDIKPSNMGFDANGTVKLFDFGLAREIPAHPNRNLTGATGSRRYMAPEVALSSPYGLSADVYSFGVFLYECSTLNKPFDGMSRSEHTMEVVRGRQRPEFPNPREFSAPLQALVKQCWSGTARARPSMSKVVERLQRELPLAEEDGLKMKGATAPAIMARDHKIVSHFFRWSIARSSAEQSRKQRGASAA